MNQKQLHQSIIDQLIPTFNPDGMEVKKFETHISNLLDKTDDPAISYNKYSVIETLVESAEENSGFIMMHFRWMASIYAKTSVWRSIGEDGKPLFVNDWLSDLNFLLQVEKLSEYESGDESLTRLNLVKEIEKSFESIGVTKTIMIFPQAFSLVLEVFEGRNLIEEMSLEGFDFSTLIDYPLVNPKKKLMSYFGVECEKGEPPEFINVQMSFQSIIFFSLEKRAYIPFEKIHIDFDRPAIQFNGVGIGFERIQTISNAFAGVLLPWQKIEAKRVKELFLSHGDRKLAKRAMHKADETLKELLPI